VRHADADPVTGGDSLGRNPLSRLQTHPAGREQVDTVVLTVQPERLAEAARSPGQRAFGDLLPTSSPRQLDAFDHPPGP